LNGFDSVLDWLRLGYPEGVPPTDFFPLLALLARTLTEDEVTLAAQSVLLQSDDDPVTAEDIKQAIREVAEKEPNPEEMRQVASRLASVGWPLAVPAR
jgi:hypothetical protein